MCLSVRARFFGSEVLVLSIYNPKRAGVEWTSGSEQCSSYQSDTRLQNNIHVGGSFCVACQCFHVNSSWCIQTERASGRLQPGTNHLSITSVQLPQRIYLLLWFCFTLSPLSACCGHLPRQSACDVHEMIPRWLEHLPQILEKFWSQHGHLHWMLEQGTFRTWWRTSHSSAEVESKKGCMRRFITSPLDVYFTHLFEFMRRMWDA